MYALAVNPARLAAWNLRQEITDVVGDGLAAYEENGRDLLCRMSHRDEFQHDRLAVGDGD